MLVFGLQSKFLDVDLSVRGGTYSLSNSLRKEGAVPCKHLYARSRILNSILFLTGSQCCSFSIGVIWSCFSVRVITLAALFCTLWSLHISSPGIPQRSPLQ